MLIGFFFTTLNLQEKQQKERQYQTVLGQVLST